MEDGGRRNRTTLGPQVGQLVMVRKHGPRGFEDIAWGHVVGGRSGKPEVRIDGCLPDRFTGRFAYNEGDVVTFRRSEGYAVSPTPTPPLR